MCCLCLICVNLLKCDSAFSVICTYIEYILWVIYWFFWCENWICCDFNMSLTFYKWPTNPLCLLMLLSAILDENVHQMAYANPTVTGLLEIPLTRKLEKVLLPTMCASTFVVSHPDGEWTLMEKPQGYGDMNDQVVTFDSSAFYPQLWINDSKGPHPRGLMCSARLQAARWKKTQWEMCHWLRTVQWYSDSKCWNSSFRNPVSFVIHESALCSGRWSYHS